MGDRTLVDTIKARLADPHDVAERLGLKRRRGEGWVCPVHDGASLSLTRGPDRTLRVKCFGGCELSGDVFDLIAAVQGVDRDRHFADVMTQGAELAGIALNPRAPLPPLPRRSPPEPPRSYPPIGEVEALWSACVAIRDDAAVKAWCESRRLDGRAIEAFDLGRALPHDVELPRWASYRGDAPKARSWHETGHRLLVPAFDPQGLMRSVRAIRVKEHESPKRLPPSGHRASGLVLADPLARLVLTGAGREGWPASLRIIVCEGEPDFLTWGTRFSEADADAPAVVGVLSGGWTAEHATKIPDGAEVLIDTDHDQAGDAYAETVASTLEGRCSVRRSEAA